ncbi:alpha/beta-hydrolase [Punctularia strigosozonata HHB-11173 SS5]|uniref:alpha/beta-hydrolase n=1 Tax=Punctularia strigosozonata (strain HHB-11173) TaxID=741275 RepID=UPI0004416E08|nr:alpha/beta-hydrolase [Punctularia strigosozonata HHB-11173 SS5]EIN12405.1 alpha/beta-hydrolase [Punctularia strigosozonata HHB-11173 SS5]
MSAVTPRKPVQSDVLPGASAGLGRPRRRWLTSRHMIGLALIVSLALWTKGAYLSQVWPVDLGAAPARSRCSEDIMQAAKFDWGAVVPSSKLVWHICEDNYECARLSVPLDYSNPTGKMAAIALMKIPSKIAPGAEGYRGPILFNPGGPGGSGVDLIKRAGEQFQQILGDDYDLIGFDPRGIGGTTPGIVVFDDEGASVAWQLTRGPALNATDEALARAYARARIFGDLAEKRIGELAQYVSTPMVARDMFSIMRAHGRERLLYWGFSYGTILGITYASMFPDNIDRMIVDGIGDSENYMEALWNNSLRDTDKALDQFYAACANSTSCALHEPTPKAVKSRVDALFAELRKNPIPVSLNDTEYGLIDYTLARQVVFDWLRKPYQKTPLSAPSLASALAALERGDGAAMWAAHAPESTIKCDCARDSLPTRLPGANRETTLAIACGDGKPVEHDLEELRAFYEEMAHDSNFAELWSAHLDCAGWKIQSKEQFHGPFAGNTSYPILLIGNTADPVTPLWNAHKMAKGFPDAAVLTQNSAGHCSLAGASLCTAKYVRDYFREGKLPPAGAVCEIEDELFPSSDVKQAGDMLDRDDRVLLDAVRELSDKFEVPRLH